MFSKIKNYIKENTGILIRLDDIAENMNWDLMKKSELLFEKYEIKPILGVIPNNKDQELLNYPKKNIDFWDQIRKWKDKGWEIGMHGNNHLYQQLQNTTPTYLYLIFHVDFFHLQKNLFQDQDLMKKVMKLFLLQSYL